MVSERDYFLDRQSDPRLLNKERRVRDWLRDDLSEKLWNFCPNSQEDWYVRDKRGNLIRQLDLPYICFNGADYIANLFTSDPSTWSNLVEGREFVKQDITIQQLSTLRDGVYALDLDLAIESHSLVIVINGPYLTVYNTYGGTIGIFIKTFLKDVWIDALKIYNQMTWKEQEVIYKSLWGFDETVNFSPFTDQNASEFPNNNNIVNLRINQLI